MSTDLAPTIDGETVARVPAVTPDQLDLIRHTVAKDATPDELKLYLYDCARQGVHPLDKLIHFTKRKGKYTPITSIDLMRMRAADTGEYAGNDQAEFFGTPRQAGFKATARVWRLVSGQRVPFTRDARWEEYCPPSGTTGEGDAMWRKMPHIMLAKCAEAQALRAGFPRQLHGLYAAEEMEQADRAPAMGAYDTVAAPPPLAIATAEVHPHDDDLPEGVVRVMRIDSAPTKNPNVTRFLVTLSTGETASTINQFTASLAQDYCEKGTPVRAELEPTKWGTANLKKLTPADAAPSMFEPVPPVEDQPF